VAGRYQRRSRDAANDENLDLSTLVPGVLVPDQFGIATIRSIAGLIAGVCSIWFERDLFSTLPLATVFLKWPANGSDQGKGQRHRRCFGWLVEGMRPTGRPSIPSGCPVQRGPPPRWRLVLAHLEDASGALDLITGTPPSDEGIREGGISEIDRQGVIQHAARARGCHRPAVGTGILVKPCLNSVEPRAEPIRRHPDPNAYRKASFGLGYHKPGVSDNRCVPFLFSP
jgi:hypothetical protein